MVLSTILTRFKKGKFTVPPESLRANICILTVFLYSLYTYLGRGKHTLHENEIKSVHGSYVR